MNEKLEQAKNEIAKEYGYNGWSNFYKNWSVCERQIAKNILGSIAVRYHELMEEEVIFKCIKLTDERYRYYYEEAKRVGEFDVIKERECVRVAIALKELRDELMEMQQRR